MNRFGEIVPRVVAILVLVALIACDGDDPAPNTTVPRVTWVTPFDGANERLRNQQVVLTFNIPMSVANAQAKITVSEPVGGNVAGTITGGSILTWTPAALLKINAVYTVTVPAGTKGANGIGTASAFSSVFRTHNGLDWINVSPIDGATLVPLNMRVSARFNVPVDQLTVINTTGTPSFAVSLTSGGTDVSSGTSTLTFTSDGRSVSYTLPVNRDSNTTYFARVTTAIRALDGTPLTADFEWSFTTAGVGMVDTTPPTRMLGGKEHPPIDATGVFFDQTVGHEFTEAIDPASVNDATFIVRVAGGAQITGGTFIVDNANTRIRWTSPVPLDPFTTYEAVLVADGITDVAGNGYDDDQTGPPNGFSWQFTTAPALMFVPAVR